MQALSLPEEVICNLEKIIIFGSKRLVIENIKMVTEFSESKVRIETEEKRVLLFGNHFTIEEMSQEHIMILGDLERIEFLRKGE